MDSPTIAAIVVASCVAAPLAALLLADMVRVFMVVRYYHQPRADPAKVALYRSLMEEAYRAKEGEAGIDNPFAHVVTDEEFEANIAEFQKEMDAKGAGDNSIFSSLDESYMLLLRESIGVVIAPRAVMLQVAHPFVAMGIKMHSNIKRDTPRRFEKTYFHMFTMAFGTRADAIKSARTLRKIHNRVHGSFAHPVGKLLPQGTPYTAAHTHAMLWVGLSLAESVMLGYQAMVGSFTPEQEAQLAQDAAYGMMLFGIPKRLATGNMDDFRVAVEACWQSDIITVSEEAKEIVAHLLYPKPLWLRPIFAIARWATMVILPDKLAIQFFGRKATLSEQLLVGFLGGIGRFGYRLVPGPLRYVPEYSQAVRRNGKSTWFGPLDPLARAMEAYMRFAKDFFIWLVLPKPERKVDTHPEVVVKAALQPVEQ